MYYKTQFFQTTETICSVNRVWAWLCRYEQSETFCVSFRRKSTQLYNMGKSGFKHRECRIQQSFLLVGFTVPLYFSSRQQNNFIKTESKQVRFQYQGLAKNVLALGEELMNKQHAYTIHPTYTPLPDKDCLSNTVWYYVSQGCCLEVGLSPKGQKKFCSGIKT